MLSIGPSIIVAMSENRVIGRDGDLPWRLPDDLKRFKALTMGHHMLMGRRTYESIGRPLPGRTTIVLTRDPEWRAEGVLRAHSLEAALKLAAPPESTESSGPFIVGGGELYQQALPLVNRMYLTLVHATVEGDAYFPDFDRGDWETIAEERHEADDRHEYAFSFIDLRRIGDGQAI